jgi:hypothetical protein
MNYAQLSPVWIIDTLSGENEGFDQRISQQLLAYSQNEIGVSFDIDTQRWWKVDRIKEFSPSLIDENKHPQDIPAYSLKENRLNETYLQVIVLADLADFDSADAIVNQLREEKSESRFMPGGGVRINYYGLFSFESQQNYNGKWEERIGNSSFDTIFLQGNNNNSEENTNGYSLLKKEGESKNFWDLSVQIIHHLVMTRDSLDRMNDRKLQIVGASSIAFEPDAEKRLWATKLSNAISKKFKNDSQSASWHDKKKASLSDTFSEAHGWKHIYHELSGGYDNLSTDGLYVHSKISPWNLFAKLLIKEYFKKYIRSVVRLVHENVTGFSFVTMQRYQNHLDNKYTKITGDEVQSQAIEDELCMVWDRRLNEKKNLPIGLQQFKSKLNNLKEFFVSQKASIDKLKESSAADSKNTDFPTLYDYPLGGFGDEYQKQYEKYVNKGEPVSNEKDNYGNSILKKLTRILQFHPVPLSLLVRSILLGILLPMCVLTLLRFIPSNIIDTEVLESGKGAVYLVAGCFLLCVLMGFLRYLFSVVDAIKVKIRDYIAWSLYRLQRLAYDKTLDKAIEYYDSAIHICDSINANVNEFIKEKPLVEDELYRYCTNTFQSNVMRSFEGYSILKDFTTDHRFISKTPTGKETFSVEIITDDICYKVFRDILVYGGDAIVMDALKKELFDFNETIVANNCTQKDNEVKGVIVAENNENSGEDEYNNNDKDDEKVNSNCFEEALRDAVEDGICVFVHNTHISNLSDVLFNIGEDGANGDNNMAEHNENGYLDTIAKYVKVMSYPAGMVTGGYKYVSYVIPVSANYNGNTWDQLFGWQYRKCVPLPSYIFSILQGVSIAHLTEIKDIHIVDEVRDDNAINNEQMIEN